MEIASFEVEKGSPLIGTLKRISFDYELEFEEINIDGTEGVRVVFCN